MSIGFTVTTRATPAGPVLEFAGDLDASTAPRAHAAVQALAPGTGQQVVVDLSGLVFCDSSGIATLIAARNLAHAAGAGIALAAVPPQLARILELIGLAALFPSYPTTRDAHAAR